MQISKDMLIGQLIQVDESIPPILMRALPWLPRFPG